MAVAILAANNILAITFSLKNQLNGTTQIVLNKIQQTTYFYGSILTFKQQKRWLSGHPSL